MSLTPEMRAGDGDRDRTITTLREAFAEGRLTSEEFQQRMEQAQVARTFGELDVLVTDLPAQAAARVPATTSSAVSSTSDDDEDEHGLRNGWLSWLGVSVMVNVIWLGTWMTGGDGMPGYWPIWVMGPWGAGMLIATLNGLGKDSDR
jgi:hypothetical protein